MLANAGSIGRISRLTFVNNISLPVPERLAQSPPAGEVRNTTRYIHMLAPGHSGWKSPGCHSQCGPIRDVDDKWIVSGRT